MFQKFYSDNLISKFIKCLLWDTYIPTVDIWKPGKQLTKGFTYVTFDKYIVKAKKDFKLGLNSNVPKSGLDNEYFEYIAPYVEGEFYPGVTSNYESNSALYDPDTHYYLGNYLRMLRDLHDINLMPYYNCYSGTILDNIDIVVEDNKEKIIETKNSLNKTYIVPVKFNQKYSIYVDSDIPFKIRPAYYNNIEITSLIDVDSNEIKSTVINKCSFKNPYIFDTTILADSIGHNKPSTALLLEDYLVLLVQLPKKSNNHLLVLEGDYSNINIINILNGTDDVINKIPNSYIGKRDDNKLDYLSDNDILNENLKSVSSLTQCVGNTDFAFSDRLIEYLLENVIVDKDKIKDNILRVQHNVSSKLAENKLGKLYTADYKKDIWDSNLRYYIFNLVTNKNSRFNSLFKDVNGFVDKDTEFILNRADITDYTKWGK